MKLRNAYHRKILKEAIQDQHNSLKRLKTLLNEQEQYISNNTSWFQNIALKYNPKRPIDKKLLAISTRHERKFKSLTLDHAISTGLKKNPNEIITNLTAELLSVYL